MPSLSQGGMQTNSKCLTLSKQSPPDESKTQEYAAWHHNYSFSLTASLSRNIAAEQTYSYATCLRFGTEVERFHGQQIGEKYLLKGCGRMLCARIVTHHSRFLWCCYASFPRMLLCSHFVLLCLDDHTAPFWIYFLLHSNCDNFYVAVTSYGSLLASYSNDMVWACI